MRGFSVRCSVFLCRSKILVVLPINKQEFHFIVLENCTQNIPISLYTSKSVLDHQIKHGYCTALVSFSSQASQVIGFLEFLLETGKQPAEYMILAQFFQFYSGVSFPYWQYSNIIIIQFLEYIEYYYFRILKLLYLNFNL